MRAGLRLKLFLLVLAANLLMAVVLMAATHFMTRQLVQHAGAIDRQLARPIIEQLADLYLANGWDVLRNNPRYWRDIQRRFAPEPEEPRNQFSSHQVPMKRLFLFDENKQLIAGGHHAGMALEMVPIRAGTQLAGYLGLTKRTELTREADLLLKQRLLRGATVTIILSVLISSFLAIPFAARLIRPIGELKEAFNRLASGQLNDRLIPKGSDELSQLSADFNRLADTLAATMTARKQWVADISHELRTPVAVIQAELDAVTDGIRPLTPDTLQSLSEEINRLTRLIDDLHQLSMADAGSLNYKFETVNLNQWLTDLLSEHPLRTDQLKIDFRLPSNPVFVQADTDRLDQLVTNLLQNSIKYTDLPGRVIITLTENARLIWADTAPSVPDEALTQLFDRLFRVEASRDRAAGGSGLGLAICSSIMQAHGGGISARHSDLGGLAIELQFPEQDH